MICETKLKILDLTKTKKEEQACFLVRRDEVCNISNWKYVSERIMWLIVKQGQAQVTLVVAYAPNKNDLSEAKGNFYNQLQKTFDVAKPLTRRKRRSKKKLLEKIKITELKNHERYRNLVNKKIDVLEERINTNDLEEAWSYFKNVILKATGEVCGKIKCVGTNVKATK
ncbi:hypothetical protein ILUMI_03038 [Ignelater luminosus]|uniref:Uncharacterized protein n=1 Tax=Ignelater luminosus TaxID=2038154 RepID=A0A8K0GMK7_IGNLU|nr:hypothetical protein ILUMI_03038 [Ignelater luminosus]